MAAASSGTPPGFQTRAMHEVRNPIYAYDQNADFKQTPQPRHVLDQRVPKDEDARLTVQGSTPPSAVGGLTPIVAMAGQTPYNVWGLYPA
jgi:hypothetical protein